MAAKCNITGLALKELSILQWGFSCEEGNQDKILENYLEQLNCPTVDVVICNNSDCENPTIEITCTIALSGISFSTSTDTGLGIFYIELDNVTGGTAPYTYLWTYDSTDFDLVSDVNSNSITLKLKEGKDFDAVVSPISVQIVDAQGCTLTKSCYLVQNTMQCGVYTVCPNPSNLVVSNNYVVCPKPKQLSVVKN